MPKGILQGMCPEPRTWASDMSVPKRWAGLLAAALPLLLTTSCGRNQAPEIAEIAPEVPASDYPSIGVQDAGWPATRIPTHDGGFLVLRGPTFTGRVTSIRDAENLIVESDSVRIRIRLPEIDCPERDQPFHEEAAEFVSQLTRDKEVTVRYRDHDDTRRWILGWVVLPDGRDVGRELLRAGLTWHNVQWSDHRQELTKLEAEARAAKRGLWAQENPDPPWLARSRWREGGKRGKQ